MSSAWLLAAYCALILIGSLAGGWIPLWIRLTHTRLQLAMSFVGGAMLGVGLLHLLPHACYATGSIRQPAWWLCGGFLFMFFIERVFHSHHHDAPADMGLDQPGSPAHDHAAHDPAAHSHASHQHAQPHPPGRPINWTAALIGLTLHSTLDGVALAASVAADSDASGHVRLAGLAVFLAVVLHKPFDSLTLGTMMALAGKPTFTRHLVNALYALTVPAGVLIFHAGLGAAQGGSQHLIGPALAFAAGTFLCIATSDLLPELQFHSHDRVKLSAALLLGLAMAAAIEAGHDHQEPSLSPAESSPHVDHDHDH